MKNVQVSATQVINARPEEVHDVFADYHVGHQAILPRPPFTEMVVEKGGFGAGTVATVKVKFMGTEYKFHPEVSEPEPGRVLVEKDLDSEQFTRFTFEPVNGGSQTRVTIYSEFPASPGLMGLLQRWFQPRATVPIYYQELNNLADYVAKARTAPAVASR